MLLVGFAATVGPRKTGWIGTEDENGKPRALLVCRLLIGEDVISRQACFLSKYLYYFIYI